MPNNPWENRRPHDAIYPIGQPPTTVEEEELELAMLAQGEPDVDCTGAVPWWQDMNHLNAQHAATMREQVPNGCGFCGEPADHEMGEWWADEAQHAHVHHYHAKDDPEAEATEHSIVGHAQCGIDSGLPMA